MIIREISTIVPRQRITKLEYECEICGLKTTNKNEGIFHHAKLHIVPTGKPIKDVGVAYFFKQQNMTYNNRELRPYVRECSS